MAGATVEAGTKFVMGRKTAGRRLWFALVLLAAPSCSQAAPSALLVSGVRNIERFDIMNSAPMNRGSWLHRVSVLGKDQRQLLPDTVDKKFRQAADGVGLLIHENGFSCTAFCVSADVIGTNAHCVANRAARKTPINLNTSAFLLKPSDRDNRYMSRKLSRLKIGDSDQPLASVYTGVMNGRFTRATLHRDWAFVQLTDPVCANFTVDLSEASKSDVAKAARRKKLFLIGYHGDKRMKGKWLSDACSVVVGKRARRFRMTRAVVKRHVLLHTCDSVKGSSGSPIFMATGAGPVVVGINSGHLTYTLYRRNRRNGRRKLLSSRVANTAVMTSAFIRGIERFRSEGFVRDAEEMSRLQQHLRQRGFLKGRADGRFGPITRRAIRRLEDRRKMTPLGLPTLSLLHELDREAGAKQEARSPKGEKRTSVSAAVPANLAPAPNSKRPALTAAPLSDEWFKPVTVAEPTFPATKPMFAKPGRAAEADPHAEDVGR